MSFLGENKAPILIAVGLGVVSLAVLKRIFSNKATTKQAIFPVEIDFKDQRVQDKLGCDLNEFLANLNKNPDEYLLRLQSLYPNECSLKLANSQQIVFLNSIESFKKFSQKVARGAEPIANRPQNPVFQLVSKNYLGSFFRLYDDKLKEIRKSSLAGIHKLSANAVEFEAKLADEVKHFADFISSNCLDNQGRLDSASVHIQQISTNMIVAIGINARFPYELDMNAAVKAQINNISDILSALDLVNISNLSNASAFKPLEPKLDSIYEFLTGAINGYKETYEKDVIQTFADYVISKQSELKNVNPEDVYSDRDILVQFFTLLMAGATSTGFTISWALYYLAKNPSIQEKMYEEMARTVGTGSFIGTKNRIHLKYSEAVINEILRLSSTQTLLSRAIIANPDQNNQVDIDSSYTLPSNTPVLVNAYAIHRDSRYWPNSEQLDPTRWLNERGELISFRESFLPFGAGSRSCIGDGLSRIILFLVVVNLVQRFEISLGNKNDKLTGKVGVMRRPPNYDLVLKARK